MKGDFSRLTFNAKNRYSRVLMQQGRMQVDADWNEQLDISAYRAETEITDFIGQSGAPEMPQDLKAVRAYPDDVNYQSTSFRITGDGTNIAIGPGRYYVGGMLFENPQAASYLEQPDYPAAPLLKEPDVYLAYLDVWQHHITALEAPTIREPALGGADTATRVKNIWQVKLHKLGETTDKDKLIEAVSQPDLLSWQPEWEIGKGDGQLTATLEQAGAIAENQLYRVEIHQGNEANKTLASGRVSFKWSRDNGAIAAQVESVDGTTIKIKPAGQDPQLAFPVGQLIELSTQALTLNGKPGLLATVQAVQGHQLTVLWESPHPEMPEDMPTAIVRRWDCKTAALIGDTHQQHLLEQSITVSFEAQKRYKTGDYWLIPARALTGNIEWSPATQPPHGTQHRYCKLALVELTATKQFSVLKDYRSIFKPITSGLLSKAGDTMTGSLIIDQNLYVAGNIGVGTSSPESLLSVAGGVTIGSNYVGIAADRTAQNGLLIEGNVGIGTVEPGSQLSVTKGIAVGSSYAIYSNARDGGLLVEGNVGVGTQDPKSSLSVAGGSAIGANYAFRNTAPVSSLIIEGDVGIGTPTPKTKLTIQSPNDYDGDLIRFEVKSEPDKYHLLLKADTKPNNVRWAFDSRHNRSIHSNILVLNQENIGIGLLEPSERLDVDGVIKSRRGFKFPDDTIQNTAVKIISGTWAWSVGSNSQISGWTFSGTTADNFTFVYLRSVSFEDNAFSKQPNIILSIRGFSEGSPLFLRCGIFTMDETATGFKLRFVIPPGVISPGGIYGSWLAFGV
jgi:hypothetical protein